MKKKKVKVAQLCLTLCDPSGLYSPWNSPGQNTEVGSLSLLQGIFPTQGSNPGLLHCRRILYQLSPRKPSGIYTMEYYSIIKKNEIMPFATTWMDLQRVILSEVRQRNIVWHLFHGESKKKWYKWTYLQNRNRLADFKNDLIVAGDKNGGRDN